MISEHICTDCDFVNRIIFLCSQKGIKYKSIENLPRVLAMEFVNSGIVSLTAGAKETKEGLIENTRQKISRDIKNGSPLKVEFLDWYCRFFNCSADYLMGYIDTPTHEEKGIQELTGLDPEAVKTLLRKHPEVIMGLNDLLLDIEAPGIEYKPGSISFLKRGLLYRLHNYLMSPGDIKEMFTLDGDDVLPINKDDVIVINTGEPRTIAAFKLDMLPSLQMMQIQEVLQNIRNYYIHKDE